MKKLAATQVDIHQRIIVIDVSENRDERLVLINPELLEKSGETGIEEGCLSIPEQRALVPRAEKVKIRALDRDGKPFELVAEVNAEIQRIVDDMFETMYAEEGIGLAATQVDIHQRIIVIDVSENRDERLVLIFRTSGFAKLLNR
ncbi:peptide deformylase [Escherichia coli]|uniref:peptide deformylase n=1 Tax=Escherichia coli TaxID=562 RepID=UPI0009453100|nr:hypothetical protein AWP86_04430 [Escherichia coli]